MEKKHNNQGHVTYNAKTGHINFGGSIELSSYNGLMENMGVKDFLNPQINDKGNVIGAVVKYNASPLAVDQVAQLSYFTIKIEDIISKSLATSNNTSPQVKAWGR